MKSYALTPIKFIGKPPADGSPHITPALSSVFTKERGYVADVPVEEAARAVRNWPTLYEYLKPEDADADSVIGKLKEENEDLKLQLVILNREILALKKTKPRGRPKGMKHDNTGVGQSVS